MQPAYPFTLAAVQNLQQASMEATSLMAKDRQSTQQLSFTEGMEGSTTWITKWGRTELANEDRILVYPQLHHQDQSPYEGTISTTCHDVAKVTINDAWDIPIGPYILECVPNMMPAERVQSALESSPQPQRTLHILAIGDHHKPVNKLSDDIIHAVAADLKREASQCFALRTAIGSKVCIHCCIISYIHLFKQHKCRFVAIHILHPCTLPYKLVFISGLPITNY